LTPLDIVIVVEQRWLMRLVLVILGVLSNLLYTVFETVEGQKELGNVHFLVGERMAE